MPSEILWNESQTHEKNRILLDGSPANKLFFFPSVGKDSKLEPFHTGVYSQRRRRTLAATFVQF